MAYSLVRSSVYTRVYTTTGWSSVYTRGVGVRPKLLGAEGELLAWLEMGLRFGFGFGFGLGLGLGLGLELGR